MKALTLSIYFKECTIVLLLNFVLSLRTMSKKIYSDPSVGVITTEIALHCCLRWLAGGSYHDIYLLAGISRATFYVYCHRVIRAINKSPSLSYNLPTTPQEIEVASEGFKSISSHDVMEGCVAAIDGIIFQVITTRMD